MKRIELITSKEYWVETLELMQMQGHTDYDIATVIADKMKEAMNYIPCCKSDSEQLPTKKYEIDFGGNVLARLEITNKEPKIIGAINGWGNSISKDEITITEK